MLKLPGLLARAASGDRGARRQALYHLMPLVHRARLALARPWRAEGRNLVLDVGANIGGGFEIFRRMFPPAAFTYRFFEPNPACAAELARRLAAVDFPRGHEIRREAAWTRAETLRFYGVAETGDPLTEGGSVIAAHNATAYAADAARALLVPAVDFAEVLREAQDAADFIVVKLDIEGAELDVLEHLWAQPGLFRKPMLMFVEFHALWLPAADRPAALARERAIKRAVPAGVRLFEWY